MKSTDEISNKPARVWREQMKWMCFRPGMSLNSRCRRGMPMVLVWESVVQIIPSTGDGIVIMTNSSNGSAVISSVLCYWRQWGVGAGTADACPAIDVRIPLLHAYQTSGISGAASLYRNLH
jgi:hypothetical protein